MKNWKDWMPLTAMTVAVAVTLGGCHVFKQEPKNAGVTVIQKSDKPAVTIQSLDARVTDIEKRMKAARDARAAAAKKGLVARVLER